MSEVQFSPAATDDQLTITSNLAQEIWTEYFTPLIGGDQVSYMLDKFQSLAAMKKQLGEGYLYYLIGYSEKPIGYLCIKPNEQDLFLSKLYILKQTRGQGIGRLALAFIEDYARENKKQKIWLTVNKGNSATIESYKKWGFEIVGEPVTDIGGGFVMDDYLMEKVID